MNIIIIINFIIDGRYRPAKSSKSQIPSVEVAEIT